MTLFHGAIPVDEAVLHTAATPGSWYLGKTVVQMRDAIDKWHRDRGWRKIGYQYVIAPDGSYAKGRAVTEVGAGVKGHNRGKVHICMIPVKTHDGIKKFETYFTEAQRATTKRLIAAIPGIKKVSGHNDYTNLKECPGFRVKSSDWMPTPRRPIKRPWWYRWFKR